MFFLTQTTQAFRCVAHCSDQLVSSWRKELRELRELRGELQWRHWRRWHCYWAVEHQLCWIYGTIHWLVVWNMNFIFPYDLGISSSQLSFIFFTGVQSTNQIGVFNIGNWFNIGW